VFFHHIIILLSLLFFHHLFFHHFYDYFTTIIIILLPYSLLILFLNSDRPNRSTQDLIYLGHEPTTRVKEKIKKKLIDLNL